MAALLSYSFLTCHPTRCTALLVSALIIHTKRSLRRKLRKQKESYRMRKALSLVYYFEYLLVCFGVVVYWCCSVLFYSSILLLPTMNVCCKDDLVGGSCVGVLGQRQSSGRMAGRGRFFFSHRYAVVIYMDRLDYTRSVGDFFFFFSG